MRTPCRASLFLDPHGLMPLKWSGTTLSPGLSGRLKTCLTEVRKSSAAVSPARVISAGTLRNGAIVKNDLTTLRQIVDARL